MSRNEKSRKRNNSFRPNMWGFLRDVIIAALDKGQLPVMFIGLYILIFFLKFPSDQLKPFFFDIINHDNFVNILGWFGFVSVSIVSFYINRRQRRLHNIEMSRVTEEKRILHEQLIKRKLPTST